MRKLLALTLSLLMLLSATAFASSGEDIQTEVTGEVDVAFVTFMTGIPYFDDAWSGASAAAQELGLSIGYYGPASNDTPGQIAIVDDLITKGIKALVITCMDSEAVVPTMEKAREAGIIVITWDLDVSDPKGRDFFANLCSNEEMGEFMVDKMYDAHLETLGDAYEWAIITSSLTSEQMVARANYMVEYAKGKYPNLKFVGLESGGSDALKNYNAAVSLMQANPELKVIMSNASDALGPIAEAIEAEGRIGEVYGTGMTTPNMAKPGYASGAIIGGAMLWSPAKWGRFGVTLANEVLKGVKFPMGEPFTIPGFPDAVQFAADEFRYNELQEYTKDNINDFNF
ncbi:MAG: substrate-binding domain-containing protein [Clostridiales bacterium]|nr:substrate-binding domain-containing protein [Clostridiales bacterium]